MITNPARMLPAPSFTDGPCTVVTFADGGWIGTLGHQPRQAMELRRVNIAIVTMRHSTVAEERAGVPEGNILHYPAGGVIPGSPTGKVYQIGGFAIPEVY